MIGMEECRLLHFGGLAWFGHAPQTCFLRFLLRLERDLHVDPQQAAWYVVGVALYVGSCYRCRCCGGPCFGRRKGPVGTHACPFCGSHSSSFCVLNVSLIETKSLVFELAQLLDELVDPGAVCQEVRVFWTIVIACRL